MKYGTVTKSLDDAVTILDTAKIDEEHGMIISEEYSADAMSAAINTALLILRARIANRRLSNE